MLKSTADLAQRLVARDRQALARAITLVESSNTTHRRQAELLLDYAVTLPRPSMNPNASATIKSNDCVAKSTETAKNSNISSAMMLPVRLGIAGPPGAGKSTLIENLGCQLTKAGLRVAVLTIDPSSHVTGGSILGDKSRMTLLSREPEAYVRASPSRGVLGGLSRYTADVVSLCESAAYDVVIVETVGLGQSEIKIDDAVDVVALVIPPAGGDSLQGAKKGIMEVADLIVVNKADGALMPAALRTQSSYRQAVSLAMPKHSANAAVGWHTPVLALSAFAPNGEGVNELWDQVMACRNALANSGELGKRRRRQAETWMWEELRAQVVSLVDEDPALRQLATKEADNLVAGLNQWLNSSSSSSDTEAGHKGGNSESSGGSSTEHVSSRTSPRLSLSDARRPSLWETASAASTASAATAAADPPTTSAFAMNQQLVDQGDQRAGGRAGERVATTPRAAAARLMRALALRLAAPSALEK